MWLCWMEIFGDGSLSLVVGWEAAPLPMIGDDTTMSQHLSMLTSAFAIFFNKLENSVINKVWILRD